MSDTKRVSLLGATGSIGQSTLSLLKQKCDETPDFQVVSLTAQKNIVDLAKAAIETQAKFIAVSDENKYSELKSLVAGTNIKVGAGESGLKDAAAQECDTLVSAITGAAALKPTLEGIKQGANIALANKESIVCAGNLFLREAEKYGAKLLPVDSEHNAIFQVLGNERRVEKLILTASGGPFRKATFEEMRRATPDQAVAHPNWTMGAKISVDSASMMNKSLELIEAHYLFEMPHEKIDVLIHAESIVHSLVAYDDGSVLAQLGMPDMRTPISYALAWPDRMPIAELERLDLAKIASLSFEKPDLQKFRALEIVRFALDCGSWGPNVFNAVNEIAVEAFLKNRIGFIDITSTTEKVLNRFASNEFGIMTDPVCFEDVFKLDEQARRIAEEEIQA